MTDRLAITMPDHVHISTLVVAALALAVIAVLAVRQRHMARLQTESLQEVQHSTVHVSAMMDASLDAIVAMDEEGRITEWNAQAERLFGWRAEEVLRRFVADTIVPPRYREEHTRGLAIFQRGGVAHIFGKTIEVAALRRDGTELPVDLSVNVGVRDGPRTTFVAFIRDVSTRQRAERIQGLRFIVAGVLTRAETAAQACDGVLAAIGTRGGARFAALWTPALGGLGCEHLWCADPGLYSGLFRATHAATLAVGNGLAGRAWASGRPLTLEELPNSHEDFQRLRLAAEAGLGGAIAVPVTSGSRVIGVIEAYLEKPGDVDEEMLRTIDDIAGQLGQYLARRKAETLAESPERLGALMEHASEPVVMVGEDGAILALNETARRVFGYTTLEVMGEDMRVLVAEVDRDLVIEYVSETLDHAHGAAPLRRFCEVRIRHKDGSLTPMGLHIMPMTVGGRRVFMSLLTAPTLAERRDGEFRVLRSAHEGTTTRPRLA